MRKTLVVCAVVVLWLNVTCSKAVGLDEQLYQAAMVGDSSLVESLLKKGANPNYVSEKESTPLISAIESGSLEIVSLLIQYGADVNADKNFMNMPTIDFAVSWDRFEIVEKLIDAGATLNNGPTLMHFAAKHGNIKMLELLAAHGASYTHIDLVVPVTECHPEVVEFLADKGVNIDGTFEAQPMTPLSKAIILSRDCAPMSLIHFLIDHGANVNKANEWGETPLYFALSVDHPDLELINYLVQKGADPGIVPDDLRDKYENLGQLAQEVGVELPQTSE